MTLHQLHQRLQRGGILSPSATAAPEVLRAPYEAQYHATEQCLGRLVLPLFPTLANDIVAESASVRVCLGEGGAAAAAVAAVVCE